MAQVHSSKSNVRSTRSNFILKLQTFDFGFWASDIRIRLTDFGLWIMGHHALYFVLWSGHNILHLNGSNIQKSGVVHHSLPPVSVNFGNGLWLQKGNEHMQVLESIFTQLWYLHFSVNFRKREFIRIYNDSYNSLQECLFFFNLIFILG